MGNKTQDFKTSELIDKGLLTINDGYRAKNSELSAYGVPFARAGNINNGFKFEGADCFPKENIGKVGIKISQPGDVVFTSKGTVGRFAFVRPNSARFVYSPQLCFWRSHDPDILDPRFLYYWMNGPDFMEQAGAVKGQTDMADYVSLRDQREMRITLPTIDEQRAIAHILGSLDDKIELNRRMNKTLEAMAQALFKSWFIDFDPVIDNALAASNAIPEELQPSAALRESLGDASKPLPDDIHDLFPSEFEFTEEMGWIPKGWDIKSVEDAIAVNPRVQLKKNAVASYVDMKALPTSGFSVMEIEKKPYSGGAKFNNGDVLLARITPCLENGKTGIVDFLDGDEVGFGSTEFIVLRSKGAICAPYIACLSRYIGFRDHCIQSMVGSSGRQRVQNACFSNFYLALPSALALLERFDHLVSGNFDRITKHTKQTRVLTQFRDTLLPKLLSGEIRLQAGIPDVRAAGRSTLPDEAV